MADSIHSHGFRPVIPVPHTRRTWVVTERTNPIPGTVRDKLWGLPVSAEDVPNCPAPRSRTLPPGTVPAPKHYAS